MKNHNEKKIALEEAAVSIFLNLYNLNRSDHLEILEKRERPDYLLKDINHNLLGLEVTHLFYDSDEARSMLNRSEPKRDKPQNSEGHIEVLNKLLKQKEKKLEQYDTDYPISLLVRNASVKKLTNAEITAEQLLNYIAEDYRIFENVEIHDTSKMNGLDLSGIVLENCCLSLDFTDARCIRAQFINCNLKGCTFEGADLQFSRFVDCALCSAEFTNAKVDGIFFEGNYFHSTVLDILDLYRMVGKMD